SIQVRHPVQTGEFVVKGWLNASVVMTAGASVNITPIRIVVRVDYLSITKFVTVERTSNKLTVPRGVVQHAVDDTSAAHIAPIDIATGYGANRPLNFRSLRSEERRVG